MKRLLGWFMCLIGDHDWTCKAAQGIPPTEHEKRGFEGFWEYATMFCSRCGVVSRLNKRGG